MQNRFFSQQQQGPRHLPIPVIPELLDVDKQVFLPSDSFPAARFVGTLDNEVCTSMACLLSDGTILTTLHSIYDFETCRYLNASQLSISFVHNHHLYTYAVEPFIVHDGLRAIYTKTSPFDYARLRVVGNPCADLGGGLTLDVTNHWGHADSQEPPKTQALSGPIISSDGEGRWVARQITSFADNAAAQSSHYFFSQEGYHHGGLGFSGQAIVYPGTTVLYAMHVGLNSLTGARMGIKISEYLSAHQRALSSQPQTLLFPPQVVDIITSTAREKFRRNGLDIIEVEQFLNCLAKAASKQKTLLGIPEVFAKLQVVDTHQKQHLEQGYVAGKGYFHAWLATSERNPAINALANCVNKIVSDYYQRYLKTSNVVNNISIKKTTKFIVDLGVEIGIDVPAGNKKACYVLLEGFGGKNYHIYPVVPEYLRGAIPVIINARTAIEEAKACAQVHKESLRYGR